MRRGPVFYAIIAAYALWAAAYIRATSFLIGDTRYFALFDDAMISMRYARHLAGGHGLVWNIGEPPVEGMTNLLWTLVMAAIHLLPLSREHMCLPVQLLGAMILTANLFAVRSLSLEFESRSWGRHDNPHTESPSPRLAFADLAVLLTAFYYPLNKWTLLGLEVGLLALLTTLSVLLAVRLLHGAGRPAMLAVTLVLATLVRIDAAVLFIAVWGVLVTLSPSAARTRLAIVGAVTLALTLIAQTAFRLWVFGDPLPNTYYLKMTGFPATARVLHGLAVLALFALPAAPVIVPALAGWACGRLRSMWIPPLVTLALMAYSAYVGGDAWEKWGGANRFTAPAMPLLFIMLSGSIGIAWHALPSPSRSRAPGRALLALACIAAVVSSNAYSGTRSLADVALLWRPLHTDGNADVTELALDINRITTPDATIALTWVGIPGYFLDRPVLDILGKCDRVIARQPMRLDPALPLAPQFYPGHMKWDYAHTLGALQPDIAAIYWPVTPDEHARYLAPHYRETRLGRMKVWLRINSSRTRWNNLPPP